MERSREIHATAGSRHHPIMKGMTMSGQTTHTPGRIRFYENGEANSYAMLEVDADDRWLLTLLHNGHDVTERQKANMHRLVACWNACEGIDTELLDPKMLGDQIAAKMSLIDQRDQLLEAIKELLEFPNIHEANEKAKAAIEKATAGAA